MDRDAHEILKLMAPFFNEKIMIGEFMAQRLKGISSLLHFWITELHNSVKFSTGVADIL